MTLMMPHPSVRTPNHPAKEPKKANAETGWYVISLETQKNVLRCENSAPDNNGNQFLLSTVIRTLLLVCQTLCKRPNYRFGIRKS